LVAAVILTLIVKPQPQAQPQTKAATLATPLQGK
jgi:hypothetical protein